MKKLFRVSEPVSKNNDVELLYGDLELSGNFGLGKLYTCCNLGPVNKRIYVGSKDGEISILNMKGKPLVTKRLHRDVVQQLNFDKNYCFLSSASRDGVKILNPLTLEVFRYFKSEFPMKACCFTPNIFPRLKEFKLSHILMGGGIIAREAARTKYGGYYIHLMDLKCEEEIGKIEGHFGPINWI